MAEEFGETAHHEAHAHSRGIDKKIVLGFAALAVLLVAAFLYSAAQFESVNKRLASVEAASSAANANINAFGTKLNAFDATLQQRLADIEVIVKVYYDSNCTFCQNSELLDILPGLSDTLRNQNIRLETVDVKGNYSELNALQIKRIPAFYATASSLKKSSELSNFFGSLEQSNFQQLNVVDGLALVTPKNSVLTADGCTFKENARLREFYSETDPFSKRLFYANGSAMNPANVTRFKNVVEESMQPILAEFGNSLLFEQRCLPIHSATDNLMLLGLNKSDEEICKNKSSTITYIESLALADDYAILSVPYFVVDCKYVFTAVSTDKIRENICLARPDICQKIRQAAAASPQASPSSANSS